MEKQIEILTDELKQANIKIDRNYKRLDERVDQLEDYRDHRSISRNYMNRLRKEQENRMDKLQKSISSLTSTFGSSSSEE